MQISEIRATELFVTTADGDAQVLVVALDDPDPAETITVSVGGRTVGTAPAAGAEVEVALAGLVGSTPGETVDARVEVGRLTETVRITVAEPGWTVWMIPHFHYDPVWWNTQAAYTATWDELPGQAQQFRQVFQQTGFALVDAHLRTARRDPDYRFVLAEVDYLKPYWDARPAERAYLRRLLAEGRLEIMGGTYNEPNTNLTTAETTARNFVHGAGFQRGVLGADPHTAWQLDAFGHDPQFPGLAADAGLTSSSWARGPHHQWGPMLSQPSPEGGWGDPSVMQFPAEFEWISPSGRGVLTHYMPAHYSAGWQIDSRATLAEAEDAVYELFLLLKRVAATRNVLLPVGTDYTPPSKWVTEIHRDWNARYAWPRFECAIPRQFFAAVRAELDAHQVQPVPVTRDMNPVYTGKDVSYIDTKQAQRAAEGLLVDAEMFATFAALQGARYPHAALDKAWRQLVYGAHHDAITGSESDQVYLDLLTGWREAYDIGRDVLRASLDVLTSSLEAHGDGEPVTVFNPSTWDRRDLVRAEVAIDAPALEVVDAEGRVVPSVVVPGAGEAPAQVCFVADAPGIGHASGWRVRPGAQASGWTRGDGTRVEDDRWVVEVDPARGGCVQRLFDKRAGREVLRDGGLGNELVVEQEYSEHPDFHEGPWHLVPSGSVVARSSEAPADVAVETSPLGSRLVVTGSLGTVRFTQTITLWRDVDRIDCRTTLDGFTGADQLVRVRWATDVPGALPVSDVGSAVVGRGFGFPGTDVAEHPWTLDNPAVNWFGLSSTARVHVAAPGGGTPVERAIGIAELIAADHARAAELRGLAVALAGQGVTATTSVGGGSRYGRLSVDSNLPDVRISVGAPEDNPFTAAVLDAADEQYRIELQKQLDASGTARVWVPAERPLREVWQPSADLTGVRDLPVLVVVGDVEVAALADDLADAVVDVVQSADAGTAGEAPLEDYTVAVLNTGMPSFSVDTAGTLTMSVLRSCTGWPSGVWIDPPRRSAPDGSNFQQQHWTHHYDYAIAAGSGDWRSSGLVRAGHELNHPLRVSTAAPRGSAPARGAYLQVDAPSDVLISAVKPTGNPLAEGRAPGALDGVTVRLVEARGATLTAALTPAAQVDGVADLDLLEQPVEGSSRLSSGEVAVDLTPMQIRTVQLQVASAATSAASADPAVGVEPYQPVYARYWLDNSGPAPMGNLPVTVHVEPPVVEWADGDIELAVVVSSDRADSSVDVPLRLVLPDGWTAEGGDTTVTVEPGGFAEHSVRVTPAAQPAEGSWWVRVQADVGDQVVEDVARVLVGRSDRDELTVSLRAPEPLAAGGRGTVEVTVTSAARTAVSARVQLISPWHTWELLPSWNTGVQVEPGTSSVVSLPVVVPSDAAPGSWWVLAKVACAGVLHYTAPLELAVRP